MFLISSLFVMFELTTITSIVCISIVDVPTELIASKLLLINFVAFLVMFAMSGICTLASSWFNRSKNLMSIDGGLCMFFLVATMFGLFCSEIIPSVFRMEAINFFNNVSIISIFDVVSILDETWTFVWKLAILLVIGIIFYFVAIKKSNDKDLLYNFDDLTIRYDIKKIKSLKCFYIAY